jgi:hypothetical protein
MRTLGPGWHSSGAITHAGDPVLESIGISRTGGQLYRLFAAGMLLRQEKEGNALYRLVTEK